MEWCNMGPAISKLRKMVGFSTLHLKAPDVPIYHSPWSFAKRSWEAGYQAMILQRLSKEKLFLYTFFPVSIGSTILKFLELFSVATLLEPQTCCLAGVECLLFFFSVESMVRARNVSSRVSSRRSRQNPAQSAAQLMKQSVRLFSLGAACELNLGTLSTLQVLDIATRWIVVCSFALPQYEEAVFWFLLVLGGKPIVSLGFEPGGGSGNAEAFLFCACAAGILALGYVTSRRRAEWIRRAAGSTVLNPYKDEEFSGGPPALNNSGPVTSQYDDYFTEKEWALLQPLVQAEGQHIVSRAAYNVRAERDRGPTQYEWVLGYSLGAGSYGTVMVVKSRVTGQLCALKRIKHKTARRGVSETTEGSLLHLLDHPNIVRFVDELQMEYETHLLMELCDAGTLSELIDTFGPLDVASARWFTRNIVSALQYLHQHGISHEDVKPGNCLLHRAVAGHVAAKLADFGSGTFKREGARRRLHGTPLYMAPEVLSRGGVRSRRRVDIWSLGVCVLEMLTGKTLLPELDTGSGARNKGTPDSSHTNPVDFVCSFLVRLKSDPHLPAIADPLAASLARDCLRLLPAHRPTAHALATHPFMLAGGASSQCPSDAPAVRHLLALPKVEWNDLSPSKEARWVLPRFQRVQMFWLRPAALWEWLVELERPFLHPDMEDRFHAHCAPARCFLLLLLLSPLLPIIFASSLLAAYQQSDGFRLLSSLLLLCALPLLWTSNKDATKDWLELRKRLRLVAALLTVCPPTSVMLGPLLYVGLYASTLLVPYVAEAMLFSVAHACCQVAWLALTLRRSSAPRSSLLEEAFPALSVSLIACAIAVQIARMGRMQERKAFWKVLRRDRNGSSRLPSTQQAADADTQSHGSVDTHTDVGSLTSLPSLASMASLPSLLSPGAPWSSADGASNMSNKDTEHHGSGFVRSTPSSGDGSSSETGSARASACAASRSPSLNSDRSPPRFPRLSSVSERLSASPTPAADLAPPSIRRPASRSPPRPARVVRTRSGEHKRGGWIERVSSEARWEDGDDAWGDERGGRTARRMPRLGELSTSR